MTDGLGLVGRSVAVAGLLLIAACDSGDNPAPHACEGVTCAEGQVCDHASGTCVKLGDNECPDEGCSQPPPPECVSDVDCLAACEVCMGGACHVAQGLCCSDADCGPAAPLCSEETNACAQCTADADCAPGCEACVAGQCRVAAGRCCGDADCPAGTPLCGADQMCGGCALDPLSGDCAVACEVDGEACDDGNACTTDDLCQEGFCVGGPPLDCPEPADECGVAGCDPSDGSCIEVALPDGTACGKGGACASGECAAGGCSLDSPDGACPTGFACGAVVAGDEEGATCLPATCGDTGPGGVCAGGACDNGQPCDLETCTCPPGEPDLPQPELQIFLGAEVLCGGQAAHIAVVPDFAHLAGGTVETVVFEYSLDGGELWEAIGEGDDVGFNGGVWDALWSTEGLSSGPVLIRVTLIDVVGQVAEGIRGAVISQAPVAAMQLAATEKTEDGWIAVLDSSGSFDPDGGIVYTEWDIDGTEAIPGTTVEVPLPAGADPPPVIELTVYNTFGCRGTVIRDLIEIADPQPEEPEIELVETHDCGCKEMVVRVTPAGGPTGFYCAGLGLLPIDPPGSVQLPIGWPFCPLGTRLTRYPTGPYVSPLGGGALFLGWSFEVVATLTKNTNAPDACPEGQYAAGTRTLNGVVQPGPAPPPAPPAGFVLNPFPLFALPGAYPPFGSSLFLPFFGVTPVYAPDDYTVARDFKVKTARTIRWYDTPGMAIPAPPPPQMAMKFDEFVPFVTGTAGQPSCHCRLRLLQVYVHGHPVLPSMHLVAVPLLVGGESCALK